MTELPKTTSEEDRFFSAPHEATEWTREDLDGMWQRRRARHLLLALALLYAASAGLLYALIDAVAGGSPKVAQAQIWTFLALAPVHAGLWWWSRRSLLAAVALAFVLFAAQELVLAVFDPLGLARGVFLKLAIVLLLVAALRAARRGARKARSRAP